MKTKIKIFTFLSVITIMTVNYSLVTNNKKYSDISLESLFKTNTALAAELPEITITCDAPRYGTCNALFWFIIPDHPIIFLCQPTGDPGDKCNHWEEVVCNTVSCIAYIGSLGLL
jgi:hypothetical protein